MRRLLANANHPDETIVRDKKNISVINSPYTCPMGRHIMNQFNTNGYDDLINSHII